MFNWIVVNDHDEFDKEKGVNLVWRVLNLNRWLTSRILWHGSNQYLMRYFNFYENKGFLCWRMRNKGLSGIQYSYTCAGYTSLEKKECVRHTFCYEFVKLKSHQ